MPELERYPNESPTAARLRIARNRAKNKDNPVKTKGDIMGNGNISRTIKDMGETSDVGY